MVKPALHIDHKGRYYWLHKEKEFNMDTVNKSGFIKGFGYCKKFMVLRIVFEKATYQYYFVPFWVFREMKRHNSRRDFAGVGSIFRGMVRRKFTYLQEGSVNEDQLTLNYERQG